MRLSESSDPGRIALQTHGIDSESFRRVSELVLLFIVAGMFGRGSSVWAQPTTNKNASADPKLVEQADQALRRSVQFFADHVAVEGGYVYQVSADLKLREGEGDAGTSTVWVQPPGTPAVGLALVDAYERLKHPYLLDAAKQVGQCLLRGQLHSGGWQNHIDFDIQLRSKTAYRVDGSPGKKARNISSFDDDQTQCALRFMMKLDRALEFKDSAIHEATLFGLRAVLRNQFPIGAWSQAFDVPELQQPSDNLANYPDDWPREFPKQDYWYFYTLNDQAHVRVMETVWMASQIYAQDKSTPGEFTEELKASALRAADFLLRAQLPAPQPAWSQQYNYEFEPVWARRFEPPSVSGGESQVVIDALMDMAEQSGQAKYLEPIPRALKYLKSSVLADGRLARFYELKTNKPLYFTKEYVLTYDDSNMPTHYGFKVNSRLDALASRYEELKSLTKEQLLQRAEQTRLREARIRPSASQIAKIVSGLDERGAWVEQGELDHIKLQPRQRPMIRSATFIRNVEHLSRYLKP